MKSLMAAAILIATLAVYLHDADTNPPGFYLDEASIALNALLIARDRADEYGIPMPLYFRSLEDYKSPTYIYLLAGVFEVAEPSVAVARRFSAFVCWLAAVMVGVLAWRITRRRWMALAAFLLTALTPAIFETGRLVFEVALYPLVIALLLLTVHAAAQRPRWNAAIVVALVAALALVEYSYAAGRALGPLFAFTIAAVFYTRERRSAIAAMLALFVLTSLVPVLVFNARTGGGLTARARHLNAFSLQTRPEDAILNALLPIGLAVRGDVNARHHVPHGGGSILVATVLLGFAGAYLVLRTQPRDRWWTFVVAGMFVSLVPYALASDIYHSLRLSSFIIFLLVLSIRAFEVRPVVIVALVLAAIQPVWFYRAFRTYGPQRTTEFNAGMERVTREALRQPERPIYVPGLHYCQARWYAELAGVSRTQFIRVASAGDVPRGALMITGDARLERAR